MTQYIEFEESNYTTAHDMQKPHSHDYFELYFLLDGKREFFIGNKMFDIKQGEAVIVPPFYLHKTEGGPFKRININISENLLLTENAEFLKSASSVLALKIDAEVFSLVKGLLIKGVEAQKSSIKGKKERLISYAQTLLFILSSSKSSPVSGISADKGSFPPEVLKIVHFLNDNYTHPITLKEVCDEFYLSKTSLCKSFKQVMRCSVMTYILNLRITRAKDLLCHTDKSIEEISDICGFSSANYFGYSFKKETGLSPFNYKKTR